MPIDKRKDITKFLEMIGVDDSNNPLTSPDTLAESEKLAVRKLSAMTFTDIVGYTALI